MSRISINLGWVFILAMLAWNVAWHGYDESMWLAGERSHRALLPFIAGWNGVGE